jgi:hypothetical protein
MDLGSKLAEYLRQGADTLTNLPTEAQRFITNPQAFTQLITGNNPLLKETGFVAGATGLPAKNPTQGGVLNPASAPYQEGYEQGEPVAIASMALPAYATALRAGAPKAYNALENYMTKTGGISNIVPPNVANSMGMATTLPKDDIFSQAVANTPSARMSEEGLHLNVMRKQKPEQAMTESVRSGVFYLPEGSSSMKHYGGTNFYGGTDKITGETLYKNPLFVKGATGGKAPEAAYAQLTDKDQLKQMLDDAMEHSSFGFRPNISYGQQIQKVEEFLSKYAPDLEGYASYIVDNSKRGNQLRYALQEAATAQKVRDAGYDAVIGHSKGKQGPFISEVFDIRESHYPNQYGDFQLNPKFEEMYQNAPRRDLIQQQIDKIE